VFWSVSVATKVFLGFVALLAGFGALGWVSLQEIRSLSSGLQALEYGQLPLARISAQLETVQQNRFRDLRRALEEPDARSRNAILRVGQKYYPEVVKEREADLRQLLRRRGFDDRFVDAVEDDLAAIDAGHVALTRLTAEALNGPHPVASALVDRLAAVETELRGTAYELGKRISDRTDHLVRDAVLKERQAVWRVLWMVSAAWLVGLLATVMAGRAVAPFGALVRYARAISRGDYDQPLPLRRRDELGHLADELRWMARSQKARERELEQQAKELEQAYRRVDDLKRYQESIVRSLSTAVVVTDPELRVASVNRAAELQWGLQASEVQGQSLGEMPWGARWLEALGGRRAVEEVRSRSAQAVPVDDRTVDVTLAPLENEQGAAVGWVFAVEDVTEATQTKDALIRSERLATIGRMSAHVTHEIRNPLSSIGLNAEMLAETLRRTADQEEAVGLCDAIGREIDRLTELTDEYLRFARLPRPELQPVDGTGFLERVAQFVRPECQAAGVDVVVDGRGAVALHIDPDQMRQALLNLIRNAKEAMPDGGEVVLRAASEDGRAVLQVEDSGCGIPEEDRDRIFDPFYSTKLTGTGLGLALTSQIVHEHGGEIRVTASETGGTLFSIGLPLAQDRRMPGVLARTSSPVLVEG
jgi:PAS domain S-box-containing protein